MKIIVLGSAAGGGVPQWNCNCRNCNSARTEAGHVLPRTQTSLAVSIDGRSWVLMNASPDIGVQIARTGALHPRAGLRNSPIEAVILTGSEIDQIAGLLTLREAHAFRICASTETLDVINASPVFGALRHVEQIAVAANRDFELLPGLHAALFPVPGKLPLFLEGQSADEVDAPPDYRSTAGVELISEHGRTVFVPGTSAISPSLKDRLAAADAVLLDGTLFTDDEMIEQGAGEKTARRMGHIPISGPDGSLAALSALNNRRHYIHINNTNPVLMPGSPERAQVEAAGWTICHDGMEIVL